MRTWISVFLSAWCMWWSSCLWLRDVQVYSLWILSGVWLFRLFSGHEAGSHWADPVCRGSVPEAEAVCGHRWFLERSQALPDSWGDGCQPHRWAGLPAQMKMIVLICRRVLFTLVGKHVLFAFNPFSLFSNYIYFGVYVQCILLWPNYIIKCSIIHYLHDLFTQIGVLKC